MPVLLALAAGIAALLATACDRAAPESAPAPSRAPSLVIVTLDTVRRDHLPTYGYARDTAPALDRLARGGVVFENAFAQETNTNPSHTSMFTGVYPHVHGSRENGAVLAPDQVTLAEILRRAGFRTAGFVSGVTMTGAATGLQRGFEVYEDAFAGKRRDGRIGVEKALEWLDDLGPGERFFLFVHLFDAHGPYQPPPACADLFRSSGPGPRLERIPRYQELGDGGRDLNAYVDRYDGCIRYADGCLGALLERLDLAQTVVVVLADHGESLGERYWPLDHGGQAFDEELRIPLVVRAPGLEPRRVEPLVETVDLLPTLLELLGAALPEDRPVQGRSLAPLLRGEPIAGREIVFASARPVEERHADRGYRFDARHRIHALRSSRWKMIIYPGQGETYLELYDLYADPGETADVAERFPKVRDGLLDVLVGWMKSSAPTERPDLDPELRAKLEALGYAGEDG